MDDRQNKYGTSKPVTGKISTAYIIFHGAELKNGIIVLGFCVGGAMILSSFLCRHVEVTQVS